MLSVCKLPSIDHRQRQQKQRVRVEKSKFFPLSLSLSVRTKGGSKGVMRYIFMFIYIFIYKVVRRGRMWYSSSATGTRDGLLASCPRSSSLSLTTVAFISLSHHPSLTLSHPLFPDSLEKKERRRKKRREKKKFSSFLQEKEYIKYIRKHFQMPLHLLQSR